MTQTFTVDDIELIPQYGVLQSRSDAQLRPFIFSAPMDTVTGYELTKSMLEIGEQPVVCRYLPAAYELCLKEFGANPNCWFAVGNLESLKELLRLLEKLDNEGTLPDDLALNIAIDIAHGDSVTAKSVADYLIKQPFVKQLMSGSICTPDAAIRSIDWGCTYLRVGVGPGSVCTTRIQTGFGVSQAWAVEQIARKVDREAFVIADGGIRQPGDACKYLALGADHVMLGRALSRTKESAGWEIDLGYRETEGGLLLKAGEPQMIKRYRGQASASFQTEVLNKIPGAAEGATTGYFTPFGTVKQVCEEYRSALRSAISYSGHSSLDEFSGGVRYIRCTGSAASEAKPHGLTAA